MPPKKAESPRNLANGGEKPKKKKKKDPKKPESAMSLMSTVSKSKKKKDPKKPESAMSLISTVSKSKKKKSPKNPESAMSTMSAVSESTTKKNKSSQSKKDLTSTASEGSPKKKKNLKSKRRLFGGWGSKKAIQEDQDYVEPAGATVAAASGPISPLGEASQVHSDHLPTSNYMTVTSGLDIEDDDDQTDDSLHDMDDIDDDQDARDLEHMQNSQIIDIPPPISHIALGATEVEDDDMSDIGEAITDVVDEPEVIDGVEIIYNPDDTDVCFDDRGHPGTKDWIVVIRECLDRFEGQEYSPPVYKAIKRKLKGRRFLIRTRRNERTSWRESTKPEVIEWFGECFNEERRRVVEGIADDDSGVDSSLQNSDMSLSVGDIAEPVDQPAPKAPAPAESQPSGRNTPRSIPTPRASNIQPKTPSTPQSPSKDIELQSPPPRRTKSDSAMTRGRANGVHHLNHSSQQSIHDTKSQQHLLMAMREIEAAEEYARPFDNVSLLQQGIAAEEKLKMLVTLADSRRTLALKTELDKLNDLARRMKYASMAPLQDILAQVENHMTHYFQSLADEKSSNCSSSSLQDLMDRLEELKSGGASISRRASHEAGPLHSSLQQTLEDDPDTEVEDTEKEDTDRSGTNSSSYHGAQHRRTIPVSSDHGPPDAPITELPDEDAASVESPILADLESNEATLSAAVNNIDDNGDDEPDEVRDDEGDPYEETVVDETYASTDNEDMMLSDCDEDDRDPEDDDVDNNTGHQIESLNQDDKPLDDSNLSESMKPIPSGLGSDTEEGLQDEESDVFEEIVREMAYNDDQTILFRKEDFGGSYREEALGGSSYREGGSSFREGGSSYREGGSSYREGSLRSGESHANYSDEDQAEKKQEDQDYEQSYRTADLGGSFREETLGGSYDTRGPEGGSSLAGGLVRPYEDEDQESEESTTGFMEKEEPQVLECVEEPYNEDAEDAEELLDDYSREEIGIEGTLALRDKQAEENMGESQSVAGGHVLELGPTPDGDELSSVGVSIPGLYGSDSEGDEDGDDEEYEEFEIEDEDLSDEDGSEHSDSSDSVSESSNKEQENFDTPNPKLEQFFDRLQHFFEVRRKVEERAEMMDPSEKFRSLKVKLHSGGIQKKNGKFKKEYQQRDLRDKVVRNLDSSYDAAEQANEELKRTLYQMSAEVKGMDTNNIVLVPLKPRHRAFEKAYEEYSDRIPGPPEAWLYDIVRGSVVCKSYKQMADVNKWLGKNCLIVKSKNRFSEPAFNGYRDLLFHVSIPYRDDLSHICEVQVHHKDMKALDDQFGMPKHFEYFRSAFAGPWRTQIQILDDLSMLNKYGEIGGQCMMKLLKSKQPDQLRLVAKLCRDELDEFDRALELYRKILIMQEATKEDDHEDIADTYRSIGLVLGSMGEVDQSLLNFEKALAIKESILGPDHIEVAQTYSEIGQMLRQKGDYAGALKQYQEALNIREAKLGREHFLVINSLQDIGRALQEKGEFKASEAELRRALKIQEAVLGDVHSDVATTRSMIGTTLCQLGDFSKAMDEHRLALSIRETSMGKNHSTTAESHTNIGIVLCQKGDYEVAEWRHRKALRIREAIKGKDDEDCAVSLSYLGEVLRRKGDYDSALKELKRATKIREHNMGRDHPITAGSYLDIGAVHLKRRKYDQALQEFRRAKVVRESILGRRHPDTAVAYSALGNVLSLKGDHDEALLEHQRAISIYENVLGTGHPRTATAYQYLADALFAKGDKDEALIEHRKALSVRANVLSKDHPDTAVSCAKIGKLLSQKGDLVGALVAYRQSLAITVGLSGEDHPDAATAHIDVGKVLAAQGDLEEAMEEAQQCLIVRESTLGEGHPDTARARGVIGTFYSMLGQFEEAQEQHKKVLSILEKTLGKKNRETKSARGRLMKAVENEEEALVLISY